MFSSPRSSRTSTDLMTTKRLLDEKCQTIEQLKILIEDLKLRHEKKEQELIKHIGVLYNDLQQNKKKMAHLIVKYQKQKKSNENIKTFKDFSTQTESQKKKSEQYPKYYTLQSNHDNLQYISATPQPQSDHSLSSPSLSTTDQSSIKHNESSSSAYNTAESLPSNSTYSDEIHSLERVFNAACTMYTTHDNLKHTIKLQEELFRQHLHLRGINLNQNNNDDDDDDDEVSSEHFYDNIDSEASDFEKQTIAYRNRSLSWNRKKQQRTVRFSLHNDEQQKMKTNSNKIKFNDQYYTLGKRKNTKFINEKKSSYQHANINQKKLLPSNMLTVTIT